MLHRKISELKYIVVTPPENIESKEIQNVSGVSPIVHKHNK